MSDELREVLEKVVDQAEANPGEPLTPVETSSEEKKEPVAATPQAPAEKSSETASEAPKGEEKAAAPGTQTEVEKKEEPKAEPHITERAPASWTKEAKEKWTGLPIEARQEILRREGEVTKALQESASAKEVVSNLERIVAPYVPRLRANGIHPMQTIDNLLQADNLLATGPQPQRAAFLAKIIKDYGIDINELDSALAGQLQGKANPNMDIQQAVQAAIQPLMAPIQNWQQQQAQSALREQQEAVTAVQRMELDPKYEFFDTVRDLMADLVESHAKRGLAITIEDAYNMAVQAHPETAAVMKGRNEQEVARQALQRGSEAAAKAKSAAVSVGSSVPTGGGSSPQSGLSLRDTIEAAWTVAGSGGRI